MYTVLSARSAPAVWLHSLSLHNRGTSTRCCNHIPTSNPERDVCLSTTHCVAYGLYCVRAILLIELRQKAEALKPDHRCMPSKPQSTNYKYRMHVRIYLHSTCTQGNEALQNTMRGRVTRNKSFNLEWPNFQLALSLNAFLSKASRVLVRWY